MIASPAFVISVRVGTVQPLGRRGVPSGFVKYPVAGPHRVEVHGLAGDAQADCRVHGGPDKAVYAYPAGAYAIWRAAVPRHLDRFQPGAMGENLTLDGWSDGDVAIGDTVRIGSAILQVSEPRTPCYKLGLAFDDVAMVKHFAGVGVSGWYYRVLQPGLVTVEDTAACLARPNPDWTITRFVTAMSGRPAMADLAQVSRLVGLSDSWRRKTLRLLDKYAGV